MENSLWIVGSGENIQFWTDNWLGEPLVDLIQLDSEFHGHLKGSVSEVIVNGGWELPAVLKDFGDINARLAPDVLVWSHNPDVVLTSKLAFSFLRTQNTILPWAEQIWSSAIPPSHSCIYWRLHHGKMPTDENLRSRGYIVVSVCSLCLALDESSDHLFLRC